MTDRDTDIDELATGKTLVDMPAITRDAEDRLSSDLHVSLTAEPPREATDRELLNLLIESAAQQHSTLNGIVKELLGMKDELSTVKSSMAHVRDMQTILAMRGASASTDEFSGTVLLIVEDNRPLVSALRRMLTEAGAAVHIARTASEARMQVEMLRDALTCCVLDVHLPDEHGFGLSHSIRHRLPRVGLVLTSGWDDHDLEEAAHKLRGVALYKSFDSRSLIDAVHVAVHTANARAAE